MPKRAPTLKMKRLAARHQPKEVKVSYGQGRGGRPWRRKRERVFNRDKFLCQICLSQGRITGVELSGPNAGVCDHSIPLSQGGTDAEDNLQTICQSCDRRKTAKESAQGLRR